jgi:hypothetical protein
MNKTVVVLTLFLVACPGKDDTDLPHSPWNIVADQVEGGMMLAGWSNGDELLIVGGELGGGAGAIARYDGTRLCVEDDAADDTLWWIHGHQKDNWYAVGANGLILHEVDGVRTREDVPTDSTLYGVWDDGERTWAVGGLPWDDQKGEIWLREDGAWTLFAGELPNVLFKIWKGWVVGDGVAYFIDSETMTLEERHPPEAARLLTVRGVSEDDVWAVGGLQSPVFLHWTNGAWEKAETDPKCVYQPLNGVWTDENEKVWIAGHFGTMASFDGSNWNCPELPISSEHFHAVWKHNDEVVWLGGNLFSSSNNYGTIAKFDSEQSQSTLIEASTCD